MTKRECLKELQTLRSKNAILRSELELLRDNPAIARGRKGETLIADLLRAARAKSGAGHDIIAANGCLIEIKYSALLPVEKGKPIRRWVWTKLFGELGRKRYDHLFLIADVDPRFASQYADPKSPYVIFDVPYKSVVELSGGIRAGRRSQIHLTTNPSVLKSRRSKILFEKHQIALKELQRCYPSLRSHAPVKN